MKVSELITILQNANPDGDVVFTNGGEWLYIDVDDEEHGGVPLVSVPQFQRDPQMWI